VLEELNRNNGQDHAFKVADFSDTTSVQKALDTISVPVNIIINNTGGPPAGPITEAETEEFEKAFSMHLLCNHLIVKKLKQGMIDTGYGRIINIISTSVKQPLNGLGVSNTIRGAVANWSKTLANELGQHGITVNNVLPGATATERLSSIMENKAAKSGKSKAEIRQQFENAVPMKRVAEPEEIAAAAAFLASPAASYINGINVPVDGGRTGCL
jgi:3-oxoacyl-[acyl-carrier protein] reductase